MTRTTLLSVLLAAPLLVTAPNLASAQGLVVEGGLGAAHLTESDGFDHTTLTVGGGWQLTPRLRIGPELVYFRGPGSNRDLVVTGNVMVDLWLPQRTVYLVAGGGIFRHTNTFPNGPFTTTEGSFTAGAGVRIPVGGGWFIAPEFRTGWEPHVRAQVLLGRSFE